MSDMSGMTRSSDPRDPTTTRPKLGADPRKLRIIGNATRRDQARMTTSSSLHRAWLSFTRNFLPYYFVQPPLWRIVLRSLWSKDRVAPDFASLGSVRSGTSLLADYILQHPCAVLPLAKEIAVGQTPMASLLMAQFPTRHQMRAVERKHGKAITGYCGPIVPLLNFPYFAKAIAPTAKVIVIMRNPVDRAFAHWRWDQALRKRVEHDPLWRYFPTFDEVVRMELESFKDGSVTNFALSGVGGGFVRQGVYLPFLKKLLEVCSPTGIHYINANEFFSNPAAIARQVYEFLGLPPFEPTELPVRNAGPPGKLEPSTRELLANFYAPYNQALYGFVGRDYGWG